MKSLLLFPSLLIVLAVHGSHVPFEAQKWTRVRSESVNDTISSYQTKNDAILNRKRRALSELNVDADKCADQATIEIIQNVIEEMKHVENPAELRDIYIKMISKTSSPIYSFGSQTICDVDNKLEKLLREFDSILKDTKNSVSRLVDSYLKNTYDSLIEKIIDSANLLREFISQRNSESRQQTLESIKNRCDDPNNGIKGLYSDITFVLRRENVIELLKNDSYTSLKLKSWSMQIMKILGEFVLIQRGCEEATGSSSVETKQFVKEVYYAVEHFNQYAAPSEFARDMSQFGLRESIKSILNEDGLSGMDAEKAVQRLKSKYNYFDWQVIFYSSNAVDAGHKENKDDFQLTSNNRNQDYDSDYVNHAYMQFAWYDFQENDDNVDHKVTWNELNWWCGSHFFSRELSYERNAIVSWCQPSSIISGGLKSSSIENIGVCDQFDNANDCYNQLRNMIVLNDINVLAVMDLKLKDIDENPNITISSQIASLKDESRIEGKSKNEVIKRYVFMNFVQSKSLASLVFSFQPKFSEKSLAKGNQPIIKSLMLVGHKSIYENFTSPLECFYKCLQEKTFDCVASTISNESCLLYDNDFKLEYNANRQAYFVKNIDTVTCLCPCEYAEVNRLNFGDEHQTSCVDNKNSSFYCVLKQMSC